MKDPKKPKKAKTGFMCFCDEYRPKYIAKFRKDNPDKKVRIGDIAKKLGKKWKSIEGKREKYQKLADKDKERYLEAMSVYNDKSQ